ncbi:MAG TPA: amidohydrolase family protein [Mycobacterium sp.]|nr:amidohydrolase family protein [Mycobacterium sp.]
MTAIIDSDQHLYEPRTMWVDHIDPAMRSEALRIEDDDLGYAWLTWRDQRISMADVAVPGDTARIGDQRRRHRAGERSGYLYDDVLPADFSEPSARLARIDELGLDSAVLFPNFGLLWERRLSQSLPALTANMAAWNRWIAEFAAEGKNRLHPVAHLTLRDADWLITQLRELSSAGVRLAMIAPSLVDGRPLSHPDHDRIWSAFVEHGITPCFHVADQPRIFDDAWYTDSDDAFVPALESVFLSTPPALAITDLIANGTLERHPELRIGIVELSSIWVPMYLLMLDGGLDFVARMNGQSLADLPMRPSEYFRRQVRVSAFSYELPERLCADAGDLFMFCSDYPHAEGTATPVRDYENVGTTADRAPGLFHDNAAFLLCLN